MIAKRHVIFFGSLIFIGLLGITSLHSPDRTVTSRADWTYPDGYDPHGGYLDRVTFVVYPPEDEQLGLHALQANIIYAWDERVPAENIAELQATAGVEVATEPGDMYRMFNLNCGRFPTNMTAYRRAIAYALDKSAVIQNSTNGLAFLQDCVLPIALGNWTYESQLTETYYNQDITTANATLTSAGFIDLNGDGWRDYDRNNNSIWDTGVDLDSVDFKIECYYTEGHIPSSNAIAGAIDGLTQCGIRAVMVPKWEYLLLDLITAGDYWFSCFTFTEMNSVNLLYELFHASTANNLWYFGGWNHSQYNQYAENLIAAQTLEEVNHWAWKCQEILWYEQPMIVCYNDVYTHAYRTDIWEGYINMQGRNRILNGYSLVHLRLKEDAGGPWGCYPTEYIMSLNEGLDTTNYLMSNSKHTTKVFQLIYEQLWTYSPYDWTPQPALAYAWETELTNASGDIQDGEKYTFHLFENATWNDGKPVSAEDEAYSLVLGQQKPYRSEYYQHVYKTNVINNSTIEIFTNATGYIEWTQATGFTVFPHHIWSNNSVTGDNISTWVPTVAALIGSGPYIFTAHVPGYYVVLERHPDWHFALPHPPRTTCYPPINPPVVPPIQLLIVIICIEVVILAVLLNRRRKTTHLKIYKS